MSKPDIICPPYAPVLMESTRAIGYSIESAIADIIDNSISAEASEIDITYNYQPIPFIAICDNGLGMDGNTLTESMRYGSANPLEERSASDLGRYGLGMKTASLSQCKTLTVISKQGDLIEGRRWDLEHINITQKWSLEQLDSLEVSRQIAFEKLLELNSGTLVLWTNLDKIKLGSLTLETALEEKMEDVRKHLELVFHRYLSGPDANKLTIRINGIQLEPFDPFYSKRSEQLMEPEPINIPGKEDKVFVTPYVLPHPSNMTKEELELYGGRDGFRNLQGFYIYRNKRLLTWGTWFKLIRMDEFSKLSRVKVDIPNSLDDLWTLDIKKSTAYPPEIVMTRLKQLVNSMSQGSKRTWGFRKRKELSSKVVHVWDKIETREGVKYIVNTEHPSLCTLKERLDEESLKMLNQYLDTVQNNLPFNNLHHDLQSDIKIVRDKESDECNRAKYMAKQIIREAIKADHLEETMKNFEVIEPFMYYMDDIKTVLAEVKKNG